MTSVGLPRDVRVRVNATVQLGVINVYGVAKAIVIASALFIGTSVTCKSTLYRSRPGECV